MISTPLACNATGGALLFVASLMDDHEGTESREGRLNDEVGLMSVKREMNVMKRTKATKTRTTPRRPSKAFMVTSRLYLGKVEDEII